MPKRDVVLANNEIYHVLNRGVAHQEIFRTGRDYQRFLEALKYYQNRVVPTRYSYFIVLSQEVRKEILKDLANKNDFLVEIISYCLMPNHFHLLIKQLHKDGIKIFISNLSNSYSKYFNIKTKRNGPLFQGNFKAKRIETDELFLHVSRYIHLNPLTSFIAKDFNELLKYPYSSFPEYLNSQKDKISNPKSVLDFFKTTQNYKKFIFDQADYQRKLEIIKRLVLE